MRVTWCWRSREQWGVWNCQVLLICGGSMGGQVELGLSKIPSFGIVTLCAGSWNPSMKHLSSFWPRKWSWAAQCVESGGVCGHCSFSSPASQLCCSHMLWSKPSCFTFLARSIEIGCLYRYGTEQSVVSSSGDKAGLHCFSFCGPLLTNPCCCFSPCSTERGWGFCSAKPCNSGRLYVCHNSSLFLVPKQCLTWPNFIYILKF